MTQADTNHTGIFRRLLGWLGIAVVVHVIIFRFLESTTFYFDFTHTYRVATFSALAVIAALRTLAETYAVWKRAESRAGKWKAFLRLPLILLCALPFFIVARRFGYSALAYIPFMVCCLYGSDTRKVLRILVFTIALLYLVTILCAEADVINHYIYSSRGEIRSSYGTAYPTDFISYAVYLLLALWSTESTHRWGRTLGYLILAGIVIYVAKVLTVSDTSTIIGLLCAIVILYEQFEYSVLKKHRATRWLAKLTDFLSAASFPFLGSVFAVLTWMYGHGYSIAIKMNTWLSSRLSLSWKSIQQYGLHLFGALTPQNGWGHGLIHTDTYEFLDSTYALLPIRYGILLTGVVVFVWVWMVIRAIRTGHKKTALAMAVIAVHSFSEHHFIEPNFNLFLLLPLCAVLPLNEVKKHKSTNELSSGTVILVITGTAAAVLALPKILSILRTVFALNRLNQNGIPHLYALFTVLAVVLLYLVLLFALNRMFGAGKNHRRLGGSVFLALVVIALFGGMYYFADTVIRAGLVTEKARLDAEGAALEQVFSSASQPVYADELEELYKRRYGGFRGRIFSIEELCRQRSGTMVTDKDFESYVMLNTGARYAQLSDTLSIYTYDDALVRALQKQGIRVHGFYSSTRNVDLTSFAEFNQLEVTQNGGLQLNGPDHSLIYGPYLDQYAGTYTVTFELQADPKDLEGLEEEVCMLMVSSQWSQNILAEKNVKPEEFDENGTLIYDITYKTANNRGFEYRVFEKADIPLEVRKISWHAAPAVDTWKTYNRRGLLAREQYYTAEGEPMPQKLGNCGILYLYNDSHTKWTTMQYLDEEGYLFMNTDGYAQVVREYNERTQITRETYLDTSGRMCDSTAGYASMEREYDRYGNVIAQKTYDAQGNLKDAGTGYAVIRKEYDARNRVTREQYYDENDEPVMAEKGYYGIEYGYDSYGNTAVFRYLNENGEAFILSSGYAEMRRVYNEKKQIVEISYFDESRGPILLKAGYTKEQRGYDDVGNVNLRKFFDQDDKPVITTGGYAEVHSTYNEKKQKISEFYFDTEGKPIALSKGQAGVEYTYDEAGNISGIRYLDTEGKPVITTDGYAEVHRVYNEKKQIIRESYFNTDGKPMKLKNGAAAEERGYDEAGNVNLIKYFDTKDKPVRIKSGYAELHRVFNEKKQIVKESYYDTDGKAMTLSKGQAVAEYGYDEAGNRTSIRYLDLEGNPVVITDGYAEQIRTYNSSKQMIRREYLDAEGNPAVLPDGESAVEYTYGDNGKVIEERYYDQYGTFLRTVSRE